MTTSTPRAAWALILAASACTRRTPLDSHGLEKIEIRMSGADVGEVFRGALSKIYYP